MNAVAVNCRQKSAAEALSNPPFLRIIFSLTGNYRIITGCLSDNFPPIFGATTTVPMGNENFTGKSLLKTAYPIRSSVPTPRVTHDTSPLSPLTPPHHRRMLALTGEPNQSHPRSGAADKWLRVLHRSAEDPSNLLQVMLAKGKFISSLLQSPVHVHANALTA
jgi:hypothetical protein